MTKVSYIPQHYTALTPYLIIRDAARAIDWYKKVFGAEELVRMPMPDGKIGHAELRVGNAMLMLADEMGDQHRSPQALGGTPVGLCLYVQDVDAVFGKAVQNGATSREMPSDKFYGDRMGTLFDPFGHQWSIGTHKEDVSPEEMKRRMAAMPHG